MAALQYLDFDLEVEAADGGGYVASVLQSPSGEASNRFTLPFTADRLENLLLRMGPLRGRMRGAGGEQRDAAREFGAGLFESVFGGEVLGCLRGSLDEANRRGDSTGLRLRLRLQEAPELSNLPWEFLFDRSLNRFIAQSDYTPVVRYVEMHERIRPLLTALPINVLVMVSSPGDPRYPKLDVDSERSRVEQALAPLAAAGSVHVDWVEKATLRELQARLRAGRYHVFHYIGHGGFDEATGEGILVLEDDTGRGAPTTAGRVATLLHDHRSLRLAVLNSCEGARNSRTDPFAGLATSLVQQGIPAVVAMQFEITDQAALTFSSEFYSSLAGGMPVDAAIAETRKAIFVEGNDVEWGTPVLYMRAADGVLFDLSPSAGGAAVSGPDATVRAVRPPVEPDPTVVAQRQAEATQAAPPRASEPESPPTIAAPQPSAPAPAPVPASVAVTPPQSSTLIALALRAQPGSGNTFVLDVRNLTSRSLGADLRPYDTADLGAYTVAGRVEVGAGATISLPVTAVPSHRRLAGRKVMRAFSVAASGGGVYTTASAAFADAPLLPAAGLGGAGVLGIGAIIAAGFLLLRGGGSKSPPLISPPPLEEAIFYVSDQPGHEDVFVMDADGGNAHRLTNGPQPGRLPDVTKDGVRMVYAVGDENSSELFTAGIDGSNPRRISTVDGVKLEPNISPDGQSIVFEVKKGNDYEIYRADVDGKNAVNLTKNPAADIDPFWSPDGTKIVFGSSRDSGGRDGFMEIYVMDADGGNPKRLTRDAHFNAEPAWSPNGDRIAYESNVAGPFDIWTIPAAGGSPLRITNEAGFDKFDPAWSPDGTQIAFTATRNNKSDVFAVKSDGSSYRQLTTGPANSLKPVWGYIDFKALPK